MLDKTLLEKTPPSINSQTISGSQVKTKYIKFSGVALALEAAFCSASQSSFHFFHSALDAH